MKLTIRATNDLASVDPAAWDRLDHGSSPFLEHGFLRALELSESIGGDSGWGPVYLLAELSDGEGGTPALVGAVPCFLKDHSYGEYIFDWGWARAASQAGLAYYPKLVIAAPVTPATGRRILVRRRNDTLGLEPKAVAMALIEAVRSVADDLDVSSIHWLFTTKKEQDWLTEAGFLPRASFQFHWTNRGYSSFDAFLETLASRKRKQIRKERRRALAAVDGLEFISGDEVSSGDLRCLDRFYRTTTYRHGGQDYLRPGFFKTLAELMPRRMQFARVQCGGETIAGALYLQSDDALYGRYWGCSREIEFLHFETAYYAGIERCIDQGLRRFEAGAQGEHKLLRGFNPSPTYSSHWIRHTGLRNAIRRFLVQEAQELPDYMKELEQFAPYRRDLECRPDHEDSSIAIDSNEGPIEPV